MIQLMEKCQSAGEGENFCMISKFLSGGDETKEENRFVWMLRFKIYFALTFIYMSQTCGSSEIFRLEINKQ